MNRYAVISFTLFMATSTRINFNFRKERSYLITSNSSAKRAEKKFFEQFF